MLSKSAADSWAELPENNEASAELQMAKCLLRAQPYSVANHVTDRSISDRRALT